MTNLTIKRLISNLGALGVQECVITYSGGGDNGGVDEINVKVDKDVVSLAHHLQSFQPTDDAMIALRVAGRLLGEKVTDFEHQVSAWAYELLDYDLVGDWINNEGGWGSVTVHVGAEPGQQIRIRHNANNDDAELDENWEETKPCTTTESEHWL